MSERDPSERFKHLASSRVTNLVKGFRSLAKLSNTKNYSYTDAEVSKIISTLKAELKLVEAAFANGKPPSDFKL